MNKLQKRLEAVKYINLVGFDTQILEDHLQEDYLPFLLDLGYFKEAGYLAPYEIIKSYSNVPKVSVFWEIVTPYLTELETYHVPSFNRHAPDNVWRAFKDTPRLRELLKSYVPEPKIETEPKTEPKTWDLDAPNPWSLV